MAKYAVKGYQWIGYDDPDTVRDRTEFVVERKLGGVMFWSIDTDDFMGNCHNEQFPLLNAAYKVLNK